MIHFRQLLLLAGLIFLLNGILSAQSNTLRFSLHPKIGVYDLILEDAGISYGGELNMELNHFILTLDYYHLDEIEFMFAPVPSEYFDQLDMMAGESFRYWYFAFQIEGGLSMFKGLKRTDLVTTGLFHSDYYNSKRFTTIGIPFKFGFRAIPLDFLSVGVDFHLNMNKENSIFMPMLSIGIGNFERNK